MIWNKKSDLEYLTFEHFEKTGLVNHCFTTRLGGYSKGCLSSLNLGIKREENREIIIKNYETICNAIGADYHHVVTSEKQIHSTEVYYAKEQDCGKGLMKENDVGEVDGFVTNKPHVLLTTFHADCTPLFFLDPKKKAIGVAHAGWRGTVNAIAQKTIEKMQQEFGTKAEDILAGIGPAIGACCFQVDRPVAEEFRKKLPFSEPWIEVDMSEEGKFKIDLKSINRQLMLLAGVKEENIFVSECCTKCDTTHFFSHRAMGEERGNMAAMMELK